MKHSALENTQNGESAASIRQSAIIDILGKRGFASVVGLAAELGVSDMSIRRDAIALSERGLVKRVRGGLLPVVSPENPNQSLPEALDDKVLIAERAAALVDSNDVVIIDAGTTCLEFARALPDSFRGTVISHSLPVLDLMLERPHITTISLGGELYRRSRAFVGSSAIAAASQLRATTYFMGAAAADGTGIYASFDMEKELKRALVSIAQRIVLLIDHSKFKATAPVFLADWDSRFSIVCDDEPEAHIRRRIEEKGGVFAV